MSGEIETKRLMLRRWSEPMRKRFTSFVWIPNCGGRGFIGMRVRRRADGFCGIGRITRRRGPSCAGRTSS